MLKTLTLCTLMCFSLQANAGYVLLKPLDTLQVKPKYNASILSNINLPNGLVGAAYSQSLTSALTTSNPEIKEITWSATGLPEGLSLAPIGVISGIPLNAGNFNVVLNVNTGFELLTKTTSLQVAPQLSLLSRSYVYSLGEPISFDIRNQLSVVGATSENVSFNLGSLPNFLTANGSTVSGTATTSGAYTFTAEASLLGTSSSTTYTVLVSKGGVKNFGSYRAWADGAYASSCKAYLNGDSNHVYMGATGDGVYRISLNGSLMDTYCDMTNGGWTLVLNGPLNVSGTAFNGYPFATGNFSLPTTASDYTTKIWKYADSTINALKSSAYKVEGAGAYLATRYFKASCQYVHNQVVSGDCATSYSNETFTSSARVGKEGKGLSDNIGTGAYLVMVNNHTGYEGYGWCVGTGSGGNGGCGLAGSRTSIKVWVK